MKKILKPILNWLRKNIPETHPLRVYWQFVKALVINLIFLFPSRKFKIIGVTGTDGKTTTVEMISHILKEKGIKFGKISSVEIEIAGEKKDNKTHRTVLSPLQMAKFFQECEKKKCEYIILEASSHALYQGRLFGIKFDIAVLTNITAEHLDFHKTLDDLRKAKKLLFTKYLKKDGIKILNKEDKVFFKWSEGFKNIKSYSIKDKNADLVALDILDKEEGIEFVVDGDKKIKINTNLHGEFNVENILASILAVSSLDVSIECVKKAFETFNTPKGRMEEIKIDGLNFRIFIDFGLTPNAFLQTFKTFSDLAHSKGGRFFAVFGATGDRDKVKRPELGKIAGELADGVFLTDDETYTEDPKKIRDAVKVGLKKVEKREVFLKLDNILDDEKIELFKNKLLNNKDFFVEIENRSDAILGAVTVAQENDIVVLFSIGAFLSRNMGGKEVFWDEKQEIKNAINKIEILV